MTPGGLFAPLLVLGGQLGLSLPSFSARISGLNIQPEGFAVVGMAAFYGVMRARLTGIVLVTEMTAVSHAADDARPPVPPRCWSRRCC